MSSLRKNSLHCFLSVLFEVQCDLLQASSAYFRIKTEILSGTLHTKGLLKKKRDHSKYGGWKAQKLIPHPVVGKAMHCEMLFHMYLSVQSFNIQNILCKFCDLYFSCKGHMTNWGTMWRHKPSYPCEGKKTGRHCGFFVWLLMCVCVPKMIKINTCQICQTVK